MFPGFPRALHSGIVQVTQSDVEKLFVCSFEKERVMNRLRNKHPVKRIVMLERGKPVDMARGPCIEGEFSQAKAHEILGSQLILRKLLDRCFDRQFDERDCREEDGAM